MQDLLSELVNILKENNPEFEIYASYDAIPVRSKSQKLFVVVSQEHIKLSNSAYDGQKTISSFTADFRISVLVPMITPCERILEFFYSRIVPPMHRTGCMLHEMQADAPGVDVKLQKLVYSGLFRLRGLYVPEIPEVTE
ncbi:MAG: hypothetical protein K2H89_06515 [Oscillospiraceae bacterium]|nr:hypothetical protein [Oscillospiraceae bacterium]